MGLNLGASQLKQRTIEALCGYILSLAREHGAVILFEDLHWADPSSLELLDTLIAAARHTRLLIICTCRPAYRSAWLDHHHVGEVSLEKLSAEESTQLIEQLLADHQISDTVKAEIAIKTDGVPLYVEELIRSLFAHGFGDIEMQEVAAVIPDSLQSSLMARLDQLHEAKALLQIGATIGREFEHELLASVAMLVSHELHAAVAAVLRDGVVQRVERPSGVRYSFQHALMRDVAYQSMLRERPRAIHSRIAATLKTEFTSYWIQHPELLAHHYTEANELQPAIEYWEVAARKAVETSANIEAERHFSRALELLLRLPDTPERQHRELGLLASFGAVLINNHGPGSTAVTDTYQRARELCECLVPAQSLTTTAEHFVTLWGLWRTCESLSVAMDLVEQMQTIGETAKRSDLILQAHHSGWATLFNLGKLEPCLQAIETGEPLYDLTTQRDHASLYGGHDAQVCAHGIGGVALCLSGRLRLAADRIKRGVEGAKSLGDPASLAHALDYAALFHRMCENATQTKVSANALLDCANQYSFADYELRARAYRGWAIATAGDIEAGLSELQATVLAQRDTGMSEDLPLILEMLGEAYSLAGHPDDGLSAIDEALQEATKNEAAFWTPAIRRCQARLILASDPARGDDAERCLREGLTLAIEQGAKLHELGLYLDLVKLLPPSIPCAEVMEKMRAVYSLINDGFELALYRDVEQCLRRAVPEG